MVEFKKITVLETDVIEVPGDPEGPFILLFHGYGADAYDLAPLSQVFKGPPRPNWYFPTGPLTIPIAPQYEGRGWFPIDIPALQSALQQGEIKDIANAFPSELSQARRLGEQLIAELNIPLSKLFIGGFSQGAILATDISFHAYEQPAGLLIFSGILVNELEWKKYAHLRKGMLFFQSHGKHDPLFPFPWGKALETFLTQEGLKGEFHAFSGGHEIPSSVLIKLKEFFTKYAS